MTVKIGFIGAGRMAEAMMRGLILKNIYSKNEIIACATSETTRERIASELGLEVYDTAEKVANLTDVLILAIKPIQLQNLFEIECLKLNSNHLLISVVAGVSIELLKHYVPDSRVIRVMPNHCCLVLEGNSGYAVDDTSTERDMDIANTILSALGRATRVTEEDLDAVTGICGSSPAFIYKISKAFTDAGVLNGLSRSTSTELIAQSLIGAGKMILESGKTIDELIDNVCSPGGTTIEGIKVLDEHDVEAIIIDAVNATIKRSKEMKKELNSRD